jgi:hypothetical protein
MRFFFLAGLMTIACGGSVADPIEGGSQDSTTDVRADVVDTGLPDTPTVDCSALEAKLAAMRAQVLTCCPFCNSLQCSHVTQDVCCPISTTATAVSEFENLVAQYKAQCHPACPAIPCPMVPSNACMPGSNPNAPGTCK